MLTGSILYNLVLLIADATALFMLHRRVRIVTTVGSFMLVGIVIARVFAEDGFGVIRLLTYGLFLHGTIFCIGSAIILASRTRLLAWLSGILAALILLVGVDAFLIEPEWLEVSRIRMQSPKLDGPIKIVVLADVQTDHIGDYEKRVLDIVAREKPDLILLLGDYFQHHDRERRLALASQWRDAWLAAGIQSPLGAYAVEGNIDNDPLAILFQGLPIRGMELTATFDVGPVTITGISFWESMSGYRGAALPDRFHIVFGHIPNFALNSQAGDLLLAGHTHGGQIRLPFLGPLMSLSDVPRSWAAGVTPLGSDRTLIVSRGIGLERGYAPRIRFLCRPELLILELAPGSE